MQASAIIEVAIGLVVTWLVISLATSQLQEFLVELFSWRSIFLKNQIRNMLHQQDAVVEKLYSHPLLQALHTNWLLRFPRGPVEISKSIFAKAALDVFLNLPQPSAKAGGEVSASLLSSQDLVGTIRKSMEYLSMGNDPKRQALAQTVKSLAPMLDAEGFDIPGKLEETLKNIEAWFEAAMDRATRTYKKYAGLVALIIGLLLAYYFNIDTIHITRQLWVQPTMRQAIVAQAGNLTPGDEAGLNNTIAKINNLPVPIGWSADTIPPDPNARFLRYFGWLLTGLAAAQGAPFWFDVLKKLSGLRSQVSQPSEPVG